MLCKKQKSKIDTWEEAWGKNWATQRTKECAHFHLTFHFTASSHVTQNILFCRQRQLPRASPKKQSTCFGSNPLRVLSAKSHASA